MPTQPRPPRSRAARAARARIVALVAIAALGVAGAMTARAELRTHSAPTVLAAGTGDIHIGSGGVTSHPQLVAVAAAGLPPPIVDD